MGKNGVFRHSPIEYTIFNKSIDARPGEYVAFPKALMPEIADYLSSRGIDKLYSHQAEMFERSLERNNIVITTSTASGKTLSFLLPVIQDILRNPSTRAIFLYPTKALASDQMRALEPIIEFFGQSRISAGVYDGDTPPNERQRIRRSANIILTNPDMLNSAFLPNHGNVGFSFIFSNLKYVVIDELHTYRGAFGSHLANVFRRLNRICKYHKSMPQFLCSSATIANPIELADNITGHNFIHISKDGSPAPKRYFSFIQPPIYGDKGFRLPPTRIAKELIPELVVGGHSFIAFCKSRKAVEVVVKEARELLDAADGGVFNYSSLISGYRAGYKPAERKAIEQKMVSGALKGLVSTNALELGIDIGKVDTTVLTGFPGTRASFWQQSGRAGRSGKESTTYLILENAPLDQFLAIEPEWLFNSSSENAVIDKNNLFIQIAHARAAAAELPLSPDDMAVFPNLGEIVPILINAGEVRMERGKFAWCGKSYPAGDFSLRNIDKVRYKLVNGQTGEHIAEFDETQAFREIHKDSIYLHSGQSYLITSFDRNDHSALCEPADVNYYTEPWIDLKLTIIKEQKRIDIGRTVLCFGDINSATIVKGHKKLQLHNHDNLGFEEIEPLAKDYDTEGAWLRVPDNVADLYVHLTPPAQNFDRRISQQYWNTYFDAIGFAIGNAAKPVTMAEASDLAVGVIIRKQESSEYYICLYDLFPGGMGYSEKSFSLMPEIINNAIKMVSKCKCSNGCPACIGDYTLDKRVVLWGLNNLLQESDAPVEVERKDLPEAPFEEKQFSINDISKRWDEFKVFIMQTGETNTAFIGEFITAVGAHDKTMVLHVANPLALLFANNDENRMQIRNLLYHYIEMPYDTAIEFCLEEQSTSGNEQKLAKHYQRLTKENDSM